MWPLRLWPLLLWPVRLWAARGAPTETPDGNITVTVGQAYSRWEVSSGVSRWTAGGGRE